jgi:uncharacterized protein
MAKLIGLVISGTTPSYVEIITDTAQAVGTYVKILHQEGDCIGLIESSTANSASMNQEEMTDWQTATETAKFATRNPRDIGYRSQVKVVGEINKLKKGISEIPSVPPNPSTEIQEVETDILQEIFSPNSKKWIGIGKLLRSNTVDVKINLDEIVSRHLAILSMTGMGKSNFVTVLSREVAKRIGTIVIFDYHNDYDKMQLQDQNGEKVVINHIQAQIRPSAVDSDKFAELIDMPVNATHQIELLQELLTDDIRNSTTFWNDLENALQRIIDDVDVIQIENVPAREIQAENRNRKARARGLLPRIRRAQRMYSQVIDPNALEPRQALRPRAVNVLNAARFNEKQADIGLAYYLEKIFEDRKDAVMSGNSERNPDTIFNSPVMFVIEEAHTFITHDGETDTKYIASKIAKEARKFGLGLCIVSQRPAKVNEDILSQMGSFAVLKLIQKRDQDTIANTSEDITENLARQLSSLNNGEALFTGRFVKIPTLAQIDDASKLKGGRGSDISATEEWDKDAKMNKKTSSQNLIDTEDL